VSKITILNDFTFSKFSAFFASKNRFGANNSVGVDARIIDKDNEDGTVPAGYFPLNSSA
jgi:hypothetical protein